MLASLAKAATVAFAFFLSGHGSMAQSTDLRTAARDSYIFTYPLVMMYRTMYVQAIDGTSPSFSGGMGEWLHLGVASPADTDIVTPNNDTPYSYAWVDVRAEPWVLTLPPIEEDRFYTSQWDDLWGYVLDNVGSVNDGNDGVNVLLAAANWDGSVPGEIDRVIRGESTFLGTLTRTQVLPQDTPETLQRIQQSYHLQPLSGYLGHNAPAPAPPVDWPAWLDGAEFGINYWQYVAQLLPLVEPNPLDEAAYAALAALGIERSQPFDLEALNADQRAALEYGITDARDLLAFEAERLTDGTKLFGSRSAIGSKYLDRALGVFVGIFGNTKDISVYLNRVVDNQGRPLDASKTSYEMTFPKGTLPPVDFFWSMTMYRLPERLLVGNPLERYSIGSATPGVTYADDGSLTLYISSQSPEPDKEANWLPAPAGPFWMVMRIYGPGQSILTRNYDLPPVRVVD